MLRNPPRSRPGICAVLALISAFSATAVYCYGWFTVALGGPFPEPCEDRNAAGLAVVLTCVAAFLYGRARAL
ncbi:hypothetical protein ACIRP0_14690 [Streptomyces sp. NPDC101733]|uniref:hypothetical protein n=1 Tax=unclassified Streptomyces TaxID=2593676 RepID=UPI003817B5BB